MKTRVLYACGVMAFVCAMAATQWAAADQGQVKPSSSDAATSPGALDAPDVWPLPDGIQIQRHVHDVATGVTTTIPPYQTGYRADSRLDATGACCAPVGDCTLQTEDICNAMEHLYLGDGTSCEPNECPVLVYANTGGAVLIAPKSRRRIADDVSTVAVGGCQWEDAVCVDGSNPGDPCATDDDCHGVCVDGSNPGAECASDDDCGDGGTCADRGWCQHNYVSAYEILVGVKQSEETGDLYTVQFSIYNGCPGANPPGVVIPGTAGEVELEDDGLLHLITVDLEGDGLSLPSDIWISVRFLSDNTTLRDTAGAVFGARADRGFTLDAYDYPHPSLRCIARFGGTNLYAGMYAKVYCRGDITAEFLSYFNPDTDGLLFYMDAGTWVADDIKLIVDDCELSSFEMALIGTTGTFNINVELWTQTCNKEALIEGSQRTYQGRGDGDLEIARFTFVDDQNHGLNIGRRIWLAWKFNKLGVGALVAGEPVLGTSEDIFGILDSHLNCDHYWFGGDPYAAFNATFRCIGEAPRGACCDLTAASAEGSCRDSTQFGCASALARWSEGRSCYEIDAFDPPCGYAACCVPPVNPHTGGEGCVDLPAHEFPCAGDSDCPNSDCVRPAGYCAAAPETSCLIDADCSEEDYCRRELGVCQTGEGCMDIFDGEGNPAVWYRGNYCPHDCFLWVCRYAEGDCTAAHSGVGCADPVCCDHICNDFGAVGRYCCAYQWDADCAALAESFCDAPPVNDECVDAAALTRDIACWNNQPLGLGPEDPLCYKQSNTRGTTGENDPGFCCHPGGAGSVGAGSVWYTFVAEAETVEVATCTSETGIDSLVEVYSVGDPSTPASACASLTPIACIDDGGCGPSQAGNNRMTVYNLDVGETYYIQLAAKTAVASGRYRVLITAAPNGWCTDGHTSCNATAQDCPTSLAPCTFQSAPPEPPPYSYCAHAVQATAGASQPFDLDHTHMDCPIETTLPRMINDVWFKFFTLDPGLYVATTCPETGPGPATTLAVYADNDSQPGIDCPVDPDFRVAANDDWGGDCGSGSRVTWLIDTMAEYMIRIGGEDGGEPSGELTVSRHEDCNENMLPDLCDISCNHPDMWPGACQYSYPPCGYSEDCQPNGVPDECDIAAEDSQDCDPYGPDVEPAPNDIPDECDIANCPPEDDWCKDVNDNGIPDACDEVQCPDEIVTFADPVDGFYDARQPHPVHDAGDLQGVHMFEVTAVEACCSTDCWSVSDPGSTPALGILTATPDGGTCTIELNRPIAHTGDGVATLTYTPGVGAPTVATFTYRPGDVDMSGGCAAPADVDALIDAINGTTTLPDELADIDRDGEQGPADVLRVIDLINGAGEYDPC